MTHPLCSQLLPENRTYHQIASDFALWQEYFDTNGVDSKESFNQRPLEQKLGELTEAFGPESAEEGVEP